MSIKEKVKGTYIGKHLLRIWRWLKVKGRELSNKFQVWLFEIKYICIRENKKIIYCGICETSNMGDIAQTYCTRLWLKKNYPNYKVVECKTSVIMDDDCNMIEIMKKIIKEDDLIFFQSGYNTHDLGGLQDLMHQSIIKAFPNNKKIMLPQTVFFKTPERKKLCSEVYNSDKKLLFFARDHVSLVLAKEMFPDIYVDVLPDIVTTLIGENNFTQKRDGIYLCRRKDVEQYYREEDYVTFAKVLNQFDSVDVSDTIISTSNKKIYNNLDGFVKNMVGKFAKYKLIVTDKYHGLIFSLAANTPVIVLKTKDHKVTSGYEWFSKVFPDRVFYADNENELAEISKNILENPHYEKLDDYFKREYYDKLKMIIDEWEKSIN